MQIEFTDRYGGNPPSWLRSCHSDCEAVGYVPIYCSEGDHRVKEENMCYMEDEKNELYKTLWLKAEQEKPSDDGWHFVCCPECKGTGKVSWLTTFSRIPKWIIKGIRFTFTSPTMGPKRTFRDIWLAFKCAFLVDLGLWKP